MATFAQNFLAALQPSPFFCFDNKDLICQKLWSESQNFQTFLSDIKKVYEPFKLSNYPFMSSLPDYLGLRKIPDMDNAKEEVRFPREVMNKLIMNYLVTG